jgi:DNA-binding response OmpR family regulator
MARIVIIEDDESIRSLLAQMLERLGHEVFEEPDGNAGLRCVETCTPDLVITDIIMPDKEGVETILELRHRFPAIKIIAMSGGGRHSATDYLQLAKKCGAGYTLAKPFGQEELKAALAVVLG